MDSQQVFVVPQVPMPQLPMATPSHATLALQMPPRCAICGTTQKLLRCAKCKTIYYCSTDHQHLNWQTHKQVCRQLAKQRQINGRDRSLQQLTNGCSAININSNSIANTCSQSANSGNWPLNYTAVTNNHHQHFVQSASPSPSPSHVLGTNENEILNSKAESVIQNSNSSMYMGNFVANSTTCNQMHDMQSSHKSFSSQTDGNQFVDNLASYQNMTAVQQQSPYNGAMETYQQQLNVQRQQGYNSAYTQTQEPLSQLSNHLINQHEKSSSYQIGAAAAVDENVMENANERRYEELCRNIINDMNQYGLSVVDDFLGHEKGMQILNEALNMYSAGVFKDGQLVNNLKSEQDLRTIRGDKITWVKGVEPGCSNVGYLINQIDAVICRANTMLNNGKLGNYVIKERTKAMVACYPGSGSHYVMHVDNPNKDGRVITAIYYLNVNWDSRDSGGVLRIFPEQAKSVADIEPKFDRLIFFWSDKRSPHEVQPAHRTRYAITVWYFDANEREAALNRCKNSQNSYNKVTHNSSSSPGLSTDTTYNSSAPTTNSNSNTNVLDNTTNNTSSACPFTSLTSTSMPDDHNDISRDSPLAAQVRPIQVVLPNCYK